jgi:hypothetical protein
LDHGRAEIWTTKVCFYTDGVAESVSKGLDKKYVNGDTSLSDPLYHA